ncbi:ribose 5-phosphate isomerase B [Paraeggerthella hongkongensis]|uniref:Ribose 5-phosphate isomerase B n=1 Tax=Paraeggerthella hongkongensis TaxID=230658 RepID=A0A3N0B7C5_9ACTN|nr:MULTISPECIES: ribose 5-phosphate isomerase B [Paraeggerthella]MBU5405002.1 ribose 5-phosphate isomerase B [Paraeggerthella hongkongensis]MCD2432906.1 ribose 5-phosphate isomerase B [Paraeggerthella hominis]RNL43094.1 ribose 5-phosphate isomerase B [Paraeggerthella hongkongensis]
MKISIASDHAGFEQKQQLVDYLASQGHDVIDRGPDTDDRVDYPDYAALVAHDVVDGLAERGVLVCGTGIGMAVAANKVAGVRAANIVSPEFAALCREHNDANVITLSGRFVEPGVNQAILDAFLSTAFGGGRHAGRVEKIAALEIG